MRRFGQWLPAEQPTLEREELFRTARRHCEFLDAADMEMRRHPRQNGSWLKSFPPPLRWISDHLTLRPGRNHRRNLVRRGQSHAITTHLFGPRKRRLRGSNERTGVQT